MRTAHIVTAEYEVGDRVLALCGKEHKVKQSWEDIPHDAPICRDCVDVAILALDQLDEVLTDTRRVWRRMSMMVRAVDNTINPNSDLAVDLIADANTLFERQQAEKKQGKEAKRKAKSTCTCVWTDADTRLGVVDCPVHHYGGPEEQPPVAPPVE